MIYFRCYIEDYDDATADLSPLEDGVFFRLLRHYYRTEKPLPLNGDKLARICKAISLEERAAIEAVLGRFFTESADGWHNARADHEIAMANKARANGAKGDPNYTPQPPPDSPPDAPPESGGGSAHPSSLITKTSLSTKQPPNLSTNPLPRAPRRGGPKPPVEAITGETWTAYSEAYQQRYGTAPIRDAQTNAQLAKLVKRLGASEAPAVAAFYVTHNRGIYVANRHPTNLLVRDVEGLRTDWATGRKGTETEARQADRTQATGNAFAPLIAEAERLQ